MPCACLRYAGVDWRAVTPGPGCRRIRAPSGCARSSKAMKIVLAIHSDPGVPSHDVANRRMSIWTRIHQSAVTPIKVGTAVFCLSFRWASHSRSIRALMSSNECCLCTVKTCGPDIAIPRDFIAQKPGTHVAHIEHMPKLGHREREKRNCNRAKPLPQAISRGAPQPRPSVQTLQARARQLRR